MRYAIRWFKCKLKPPNKKTRQEECIFTCFYFQMIEIKEIFEEIVLLDTSELRFGSVQSFPPPYLHKEPV